MALPALPPLPICTPLLRQQFMVALVCKEAGSAPQLTNAGLTRIPCASQNGTFYEATGFDAVMLVEHARVNPQSIAIPRAGVPVQSLSSALRKLVGVGLRTVSVHHGVVREDVCWFTSREAGQQNVKGVNEGGCTVRGVWREQGTVQGTGMDATATPTHS
jgi:hypothetical protein